MISVLMLATPEGLCASLIRGHALTNAKAVGSDIPYGTSYSEEGVCAQGCGDVAQTSVNNIAKILTMGFPTERHVRPCPPLFQHGLSSGP